MENSIQVLCAQVCSLSFSRIQRKLDLLKEAIMQKVNMSR